MMLAGVVVLYHPDDSVIANIHSYIDGIEKLFVIDNSEQTNPEIFQKLQLFEKIEYIDNQENMGIAYSLNIAADLALKEGYHYLLTMDQDSRFPDREFAKFLKRFVILHDQKVALVSPLQSSYKIQNKVLPETEEVFTAITSGNIIDLAVWKKIGYFNEKLFIDGVDWDYCIRLQQEGYKIVRFNNIMLEHHLGSTVQHKNIFKKDITIHQHNGLRRYYMTRNWLYLTFKYGLVYPRFSFATMKSLLREIKNILLYESGKSVKLYWVYKGFVDFLSGSYGKKNV